MRGECFCTAVSYEVTGEPILSAFCHCTNCQRLLGRRLFPIHGTARNGDIIPSSSVPERALTIFTRHPTGCPFVHTIHFPASAFTWTHAAPHEERLDAFVVPSKPYKTRWRCKTCGACVMSENAKTGSCSVWGAHLIRDAAGKIVDWARVQPTAHVFYGTRMLDVPDDLGKWEGDENGSARLDSDARE